MKLHEQLNNELKEAMKSNDIDIKNYTRNIKSKLAEYCVANKIDRSVLAEDNVLITVITIYKKSLEKAIELFGMNKTGEKIIEEYKKEIVFLDRFLPKQEDMEKEISIVVSAAITYLNVNDIKQIGKVVGFVMKDFKDKNKSVDGALVKKLVIEELNRRHNGP